MTPVIPSSINNILLIPGIPFTTRKNECLKRCNLLRNSTKQTWSSQKYVLPLSTSVRLFPQFRSGFSLNHKSRIHITSATGTDLALEEADSPVADEDSGGASEVPSDTVGTSAESSVKSDARATPAQIKRSRPTRKSDMPPVKPEELVPGAAFTGKVRSIQPFGAFVDFGAFTDGLVHVSRLSDNFVKDVGNVVSVGQEVKVRLVEANMETGRISLTMRESDDISKLQQRTDAPSGDKSRPPRKGTPRPNQKRNEVKKATKFAKGQDLEGTVKNLTRSGAFISLPEGEEGFLPTSEELDEGFVNMMGGSSLQVGQEVSVRVLRITRGQVTLTMKKEEAIGELDSKLQGVVHTATNPFLLAFRRNKDIGAFLDEREKEVKPAESSGIPQTSDEMGGKVNQAETKVDEVQDLLTSSSESDKIEGKVNESGTLLDEREKEAEQAESSGIPQTSDEMGGKVSQITTEVDELQDQLTSSSESDKIEAKVNESGTLLDEREKEVEQAESSGIAQTSDEMGGKVSQTTTEVDELQDQLTSSSESDKIEAKVNESGTLLDEREKEAEQAESSAIPQSSDEMGEMVSQTETEVDEVQDQLTSSSESDKIEGKVNESGTLLDEREKEAEQAESSEIPQTSDEMEKKVSQTPTKVDEVQDQLKSSSESDKIEGKVNESGTLLDEREKEAEKAESSGIPQTSDEMGEKVSQTETEVDEVQDQLTSSSKVLVNALSAVDEMVEDDETSLKELVVEGVTVEDASIEIANDNKDAESIVSNLSDGIDGAIKSVEEKAEVSSEILAPEESISTSDQLTEEAPAIDSVEVSSKISSPEGGVSAIEEVSTNDGLENDGKSDLSRQIADPIVSESEISKEFIEESQADDTKAKDVQIPTPNAGNEILSATIAEDEKVGINPDKNGSITSSNGQIDVPKVHQSTNNESQVNEEVENEIDTSKAKDELKNETPAADNEIPPAALVEDEKVGSIPEKNGTVTNTNGQSGGPSPKESTTKAAISPALVKQLREETGAGMMDCKKALSETEGDLEKAQEFLRKKGLASADKKASRATAEGRIGSYIHDSRIGILIEVNCETDFVSRGEIFKELVDDLAMQAAACPQVQYLVTDDVPKETVDKERDIEMQKEDLLSKPEQIRSKIVEGRIRKRLEELALLEQPYIKNDKMVVKDWVKQTIATIGENIKVKRFVRYNLGEGLEKKSQDFAAEVAAQTAAKQLPSPGKEQPAVVEAKGTVDTPPKATVSAALVKQLREETGAGMMDCKKALSETGGDLEKAQEYLRKKGLSAADKKSSRLAAEGRIGSYIHDARIGVLIEINCETDFVGRSEKFKELVDDLAMQVVACPQVQFVSIEDIPESVKSKEKELEMQREDLLSKPENIRERIVEGRISKRLGELALLEQPFIKDDSILVKDLVKQTVAALGENIKVRRFVRFTLGETNESAKTENEARDAEKK